MNREALWNQIDLKYQAGAFGPIGELQTLVNLWTYLEDSDYPNASKVKANLVRQIEEAKAAQEEQASLQRIQQMFPQIGANNAMPRM